MDEAAEMSKQHEHGIKTGSLKRRGKLTELDRLKKRQKELQIMKMSQEWDARRHKRRMDRIQWLQQRKNHTPSSTEQTQSATRSGEDSTNDYMDSSAVLAKINSSPVSTHSSSEFVSDGLQEIEVESQENETSKDESYGQRNYCEKNDYYGGEQSHCTACDTNEEYKSVVVKTERQDSDSFCNSNESKAALPSNSKNSYRMILEPNKKLRREVM